MNHQEYFALVEEEARIARIIAESNVQVSSQQTQNVASADAGAGGIPPYSYFHPAETSDIQLIIANNQSLIESLGMFTDGNVIGLTELTINDTTNISGYDLELLNDITSISFPLLVSIDPTVGYLWISDCPSLTTLSMPNYIPSNGVDQTLNNNALDATSVNSFLRRCVLNVDYVSGVIDLSGGTNAAPTGQGITDANTLTGRGVTVTTN